MKKIIYRLVATLLGSLSTLSFGALVHAQGQIPQYQSVQVGTVTDLLNKFATALNYFATLIMIIAVAMILYAGFLFITAGDNEDSVSTGRQMITWGIVGLIVAFLAYSVPAIVRTLIQ